MATLTIGPDVAGGFTGAAALLAFGAPGTELGLVTDTVIRINSPTVSYVIRGEGLITNVVGGFPVGAGGTVTSVRALNGEDAVMTISDVAWNWTDFSAAIVSEATGTNRSAFDAFLFGETYTYLGNPLNDVLAVGAQTNEGVPVSFGGHDTFLFRAGNDNFALGAGNDTARGAEGRDSLHGEDGEDVIFGNGGSDFLTGGAGNDSLVGAAGRDRLFGGADDDEISGGGSNDVVDGGAGNDVLAGGGGVDTFFGMTGDDTMNGNNGNDVFDFVAGNTGDDEIIGFRVGRDGLVLGVAADWSITSAAGSDLVLTSVGGATITFTGLDTDGVTLNELLA